MPTFSKEANHSHNQLTSMSLSDESQHVSIVSPHPNNQSPSPSQQTNIEEEVEVPRKKCMKRKANKGLRSNLPAKIKKNNIGEKRKLPNSWVGSQIKNKNM